jgi:hypothetical protein
MKTSLVEQLKQGKSIKVKHPQYDFTIHAELKLEDGKPQVYLNKIGLPRKSNKRDKLLLKLVEIYCYDVLCNNLLGDVLNSREYLKVIEQLNK